MAMRSSCGCVLAPAFFVAFAVPGFALAQGSEEESPWEQGDNKAEEATEAEGGAEEPAAEPEKAAEPPKAEPTWWFGLYFQDALVPSFMLKLFLDEAPT